MHPNENRDLASGRDARYRERKRGGENPFSTSLFAGANRRVYLLEEEKNASILSLPIIDPSPTYISFRVNLGGNMMKQTKTNKVNASK
jgi:hypothetical protein